jgi:hypothetical protein
VTALSNRYIPDLTDESQWRDPMMDIEDGVGKARLVLAAAVISSLQLLGRPRGVG